MKSNSPSYALVLAGLLSLADPVGAQNVKTISHGERVSLHRSLPKGKHTVVYFYADW